MSFGEMVGLVVFGGLHLLLLAIVAAAVGCVSDGVDAHTRALQEQALILKAILSDLRSRGA